MIHLHVHSEYSSLDGFAKVKDIVKKAKELNQPAIAITDHGNLNGCYKFYTECKKQGIKPILGIEAYLVKKEKTEHPYHIVLLAKNLTGWKNLLKLHKISYLNFYRKPKITFEHLKTYNEGVVCLTSCADGPISYHIRNKNLFKGEENLQFLLDVFKNDLYIELMDHGIDFQKEINHNLKILAKEYRIKTIATNDCHYVNKKDSILQDYIIRDQLKQTIYDERKIGSEQDEFYIKSTEEMPGNEQDKNNTIEVSEKCNVEFPSRKFLLPSFDNQQSTLMRLIQEGIANRKMFLNEEYMTRLRTEYRVICDADLIGYFLVVYDYIKWAKDNNILVGPGRGSVGGCLIGYLLNIHDIDPIKHKLLFSRFYNEGRSGSLPDIDIDFPENKIEQVRNYILSKYGKEKIAHIGTYTYLQKKSSLKLICRVLGIDFKEANYYSSIINDEERVKELSIKNKTFKNIVEKADKINGLATYSSIHAAGMIISPIDLEEIIPLRVNKDNGFYVSCWDMKDIEDNGLIKYDFLSLNTLDIIQDTLDAVNIKIADIPIDDKKAFHLIHSTSNIGIFQLSSEGISKIANQIDISSIDDISIIVALYRPGPIECNLHRKYIKRRMGKETTKYYHPLLEKVLEETYGVFVFQEQIIKTAMVLANFSETEADLLRKAIGKKIPELMEKQKIHFYEGCKQNNIDKKAIDKIWEEIEKFAGYCFNRCIDGDCYINRDNTKGTQYTIKEMYDLKNLPLHRFKNDRKKYVLSQKYKKNGYGKAMNLIDDRIFIDNIKEIYYQGIRECYKITLCNGETITTTSNHKFPTSCGIIKEVELLHKNDVLLCFGDYEKNNKSYSLSDKKQLDRKKRWSKGLLSKEVKISKIEYVGKKEVYDIEMENEPHNLFVNNIATCNSHSVGYAYITYYTAYLKAHYPYEFMAALLNNNFSNNEKLSIYLRECENMGIEVSPPSVIKGGYNFKAKNSKIIFGLKGISGIGEKTAKEIYTQEYEGFEDYCIKNKPNKKTLEALIEAGAFDEFGYNRNQLLQISGRICEIIKKRKKNLKTRNLFTINHNFHIPKIEELPEKILADKEYKRLNTYLIHNPLKNVDLETPNKLEGDIFIEGYLMEIKEHITKKSKSTMAFLTIATNLGIIECLIFPSLYKKQKDLLKEGTYIAVIGDYEDKLLIKKIWRKEDVGNNIF